MAPFMRFLGFEGEGVISDNAYDLVTEQYRVRCEVYPARESSSRDALQADGREAFKT